jgi:predicted nucleic acid-binding protein
VPTNIAVIDANVLYSIEVTDVLLTLATRRSIRIHWSPELLDEVRRNLIARPDLSTSAVDYRIEQMNRALPGALDHAPTDRIAEMPVNDKDRHVLALAVHVAARRIVTHNTRDFPSEACQRYGVEAVRPDDYLAGIARLDRAVMFDALDEIAARRKRPPKSVNEILDRLATTLPTFVRQLREVRTDEG